MDSMGQLIYVCIFGFSLGYHLMKIKKFGFYAAIYNEDGMICWEMEDVIYQVLYQILFVIFGFYNTVGIFQLILLMYSAMYISYIFGMMGEPITYFKLSLLRMIVTPALLTFGGFFKNVF